MRYTPMLKMLMVITFTEMLIMLCLHLYTGDTTSLWLDMLDVAILALVTCVVMQVWIVRPLQQARAQDALFHAVAEDSHVGLVITDPAQGNAIIYTNAAFSAMTGYSMSEVKGKYPGFLSEGHGRQADQEKIRTAIKAVKPVHALLINSRKDGTVFWNDLHLSPISIDGGVPHYWLGLMHDISETQALNLQVEHLVGAMEQAGDMICIFNQQGCIDYTNQTFTRHVGLDKEQLKGQQVWHYWCDENWTEQLVRNALKQRGQWSGRNQWCRENRVPYEAMTNITVVEGHDGAQMYIAVIRDMTEEIETGEQFVQAQKMEAMGTLAGGIAHDFNNMLAAMLGNLHLLKKNVVQNESAVRRIEAIERQGHFGADLIRQMLVFARKKTLDRQNFDLKLLADETFQLLQTSTPENICLNMNVDETRMMIDGDPSLLQSSLINLVNNARHAVEDMHVRAIGGGVINLSIHCVDVDSIDAEISQAITASERKDVRQCVHIAVSDNGSGMDKKTQAHAFEPYFTTKDEGKGTGLGLPMVMGCVEMHGGWIGLTSSPGKGAHFDIYLPLSSSSIAQHLSYNTALHPGNGELILLADDEPIICESICEMLEDAGYRVITASDGEQALQHYMVHQADIRMAILDCVMPAIGGVEVAELIWKHSGDAVKTVLMTGYDLEGSLAQEWTAGDMPLLLQKPWPMEKLNVALKSMNSCS